MYKMSVSMAMNQGFEFSKFEKLSFMWIQRKYKSGSGGRPKKRIYHREYELDRYIDLQKKPSLILRLKSIIQSQKDQFLLLRDLEKEVGIVQKWNFMALIEKYPTVFRVSSGDRNPPSVMLTEKARRIAAEEDAVKAEMEPILVRNLRKLLMLSVDCRLSLDKIDLIRAELGLPKDFKKSLIPKFPEFFAVTEFNGNDYLHLENWDSSLAVTAREEKLACNNVVLPSKFYAKKLRMAQDGNFPGPFAFRIKYPAGFRPNMTYLTEVQRWQKMEFPSPYLNAKGFDISDQRARKRVLGVLHELLSLSMEKKMTSAQLDAFHGELRLPARLLLCLIKHHGIFYLTNKGAMSTVFLKEGYDGPNLIEKCPLLKFNDKFVALTGRRDDNVYNGFPLSST